MLAADAQLTEALAAQAAAEQAAVAAAEAAQARIAEAEARELRPGGEGSILGELVNSVYETVDWLLDPDM